MLKSFTIQTKCKLLNFLRHIFIPLVQAWSLWIDGKSMDLVDLSLAKSCSRTEALRCIQIGLLCVQDNPNYRPLMSSVVTMLENESTPLSVPKQPVYFSYAGTQGTRGENTSSSVNNMTLSTVLEGRQMVQVMLVFVCQFLEQISYPLVLFTMFLEKLNCFFLEREKS